MRWFNHKYLNVSSKSDNGEFGRYVILAVIAVSPNVVTLKLQKRTSRFYQGPTVKVVHFIKGKWELFVSNDDYHWHKVS
jgi:hypothetical protein